MELMLLFAYGFGAMLFVVLIDIKPAPSYRNYDYIIKLLAVIFWPVLVLYAILYAMMKQREA